MSGVSSRITLKWRTKLKLQEVKRLMEIALRKKLTYDEVVQSLVWYYKDH